MFHGSGRMEGLGFNLCVAPTGSLGPSISEDLSVDVWKGLRGRYLTRNDYIEFINRERSHGMMWLKFKSC